MRIGAHENRRWEGVHSRHATEAVEGRVRLACQGGGDVTAGAHTHCEEARRPIAASTDNQRRQNWKMLRTVGGRCELGASHTILIKFSISRVHGRAEIAHSCSITRTSASTNSTSACSQ